MLDFHCHILAGVDDGSNSLNESLKMLEELEKQGVDKLVCTSHFYPQDEDVDMFLERRNKAYSELKEAYKGPVELIKGCEVHFFNSIANSSDILKLCVENTDLLLLELPLFKKVDITPVIALNTKLQVVLAHFERYLNMYSRGEIDTIISRGVYLQSNCEMFSDKYFDLIKDYFEESSIKFIGSDCHNLTDRKPNIELATRFIEKEYSKEYLDEFIEESLEILKERNK